jgi:hypothetical protein
MNNGRELTGDGMLSFFELEQKFGTAAAYHYLSEIEKAARISASDVLNVDPETRLALACQMQDGMTVEALAA